MNKGTFCNHPGCLTIIHTEWGVYECHCCRYHFCAEHLFERVHEPRQVCAECLEAVTPKRAMQ